MVEATLRSDSNYIVQAMSVPIRWYKADRRFLVEFGARGIRAMKKSIATSCLQLLH